MKKKASTCPAHFASSSVHPPPTDLPSACRECLSITFDLHDSGWPPHSVFHVARRDVQCEFLDVFQEDCRITLSSRLGLLKWHPTMRRVSFNANQSLLIILPITIYRSRIYPQKKKKIEGNWTRKTTHVYIYIYAYYIIHLSAGVLLLY